MLWAVATNRTLLWKYYDKESCELYAPKLRQDPIHCVVANRLQDCSEILERAPWVSKLKSVKYNVLDDETTNPPYCNPLPVPARLSLLK